MAILKKFINFLLHSFKWLVIALFVLILVYVGLMVLGKFGNSDRFKISREDKVAKGIFISKKEKSTIQVLLEGVFDQDCLVTINRTDRNFENPQTISKILKKGTTYGYISDSDADVVMLPVERVYSVVVRALEDESKPLGEFEVFIH